MKEKWFNGALLSRVLRFFPSSVDIPEKRYTHYPRFSNTFIANIYAFLSSGGLHNQLFRGLEPSYCPTNIQGLLWYLNPYAGRTNLIESFDSWVWPFFSVGERTVLSSPLCLTSTSHRYSCSLLLLPLYHFLYDEIAPGYRLAQRSRLVVVSSRSSQLQSQQFRSFHCIDYI